MPHCRALIVALALTLAGCQAAPSGVAPAASLAPRTLEAYVKGPAALGHEGAIVSQPRLIGDYGSGLIGDYGSGLISSSGGHFAPGFRVAYATSHQLPVAGAIVQLETLDGQPVGAPRPSDGQGRVLLAPGDRRTLSAVARFTVDGQDYRVTTLLAGDEPKSEPVLIDPIHTLIEARLRQLVGAGDTLPGVTAAKLKRVWMICADADVTVTPEALRADQSGEVLERAWQRALESHVTSPAQKAEIQAFMDEVRAQRQR